MKFEKAAPTVLINAYQNNSPDMVDIILLRHYGNPNLLAKVKNVKM